MSSEYTRNAKDGHLTDVRPYVYQSMTPVFTNPKYTIPKSPAFQP